MSVYSWFTNADLYLAINKFGNHFKRTWFNDSSFAAVIVLADYSDLHSGTSVQMVCMMLVVYVKVNFDDDEPVMLF